MENTVLGILAHVDAGKTTLSEGLLYEAGQLRKLGRVDHRDSFLDGNTLERERGITIFSKQAIFPLGNRQVTLLDTPGHVDFSAEMERALQVMDCALLVVSATDGVQSHTRTLWQLLERYHVPTAIFCNKMDLPVPSREDLISTLQDKLSPACLDFCAPQNGNFWEQVALTDEDALSEYLEKDTLDPATVSRLFGGRKLFPCWFGSALKLDGIRELLKGLETYLPHKSYHDGFSAQVYKVEKLPTGQLTHLKITGGELKVKTFLTNAAAGVEEDQVWEEKVDQIRLYSGEKFQTVDAAPAGTLCAVTGLTKARPGDRFGEDAAPQAPVLEPVRAYEVLLPEGQDPYIAYRQICQLAEEDPQLHVTWDPQLRVIRLRLMGEVQGEVLRRLLMDRFGLEVTFGPGSILYRETLAAPVIGVGHFEPLRHYAEVHLLLEPAPPGSGLTFQSRCPQEVLDFTWQRLILSVLAARDSFPGVLTGSPVTDLKVTLIAGRAHPKHTEGGDFRQAAFRAFRQGLMSGESVLLEPWYDLRLELPQVYVGRAMSDLTQMGATLDPMEIVEDNALLTGSVPVAAFGDYPDKLAAYTQGMATLTLLTGHYSPTLSPPDPHQLPAYDPLRDTENPADSIFCSHGAGHSVPWDEAPKYMHVSSGFVLNEGKIEPVQTSFRRASTPYTGTVQQDKELQAIFERTYGAAKPFDPNMYRKPAKSKEIPDKVEVNLGPAKAEYLLVDGYNIIYAWDELKSVAVQNLDLARQLLADLLSNYQAFRGNRVILVFDAYKVHGGIGEVSRYHNITIVYTKEAETADSYIERTTYELKKENRVRVATSDGLVQVIILGHGALRVSATALHDEIEEVMGQISKIVANSQLPRPSQPIAHAFEKAKKKAEFL